MAIVEFIRDLKDQFVAELTRWKYPNNVILAVGLLVNLGTALANSIVGPFFPQAAQRLFNAPAAEIGYVFTTYPVAMVLISPLSGYMCSKVGRVTVLVIGEALMTWGTVWFGVASTMEQFFVARFIQGAGGAASQTAAISILSAQFSEDLGSVLGFIEIFSGAGLLIGPPMGSALYAIGGFRLPFFVMSAVPLLIGISMPLLMRRVELRGDSEEARLVRKRTDFVSSCKLLLTPGVFCGALALCASTAAVTFIEPTLALQLEARLGVQPTGVGAIFMLPAIFYAVASPLLGGLSDRFGGRTMLIAGLYLLCIAYLLLGPWPPLHLPVMSYSVRWTLEVASLCLIGVAFAAASIPSIPEMQRGADPRAVDAVSGVASAVGAMGAAIGPSAGGTLTSLYGFAHASAMYGFSMAVAATLILLITWHYASNPRYTAIRDVPSLEEALSVGSDTPALGSLGGSGGSGGSGSGGGGRGDDLVSVASDKEEPGVETVLLQ